VYSFSNLNTGNQISSRALKSDNCICATERDVYKLVFIAESKITNNENNVLPTILGRSFAEFSSPS